MASYLMDLVYSLTCCFPGSPQLRINSRSFKILRLLGEGGFSYVYLVQDTTAHALYALKKIRCPFGQESVSLALKEVEAYTLFSPHPNIISSVDHSVASDKSDPGAKTVYILLPYYRRGNLQDLINANLVNHTRFPERRLMALFLGVCRALKAMHRYRVGKAPGGKGGVRGARKVREEAARADEEAEEEVRGAEGNIMIDDDGKTPILMDLGSLAPSPIAITSRSLALAVQDTAAEHSTMPYRAPELFDVKTGSIVDTKVDIWSLGCTLYACLVGKSPFEARSEETGGSLSLCVLGGDWRFPGEGQREQRGKQKQSQQPNGGASGMDEEAISEPVKEVVRRCLKVEPGDRPDVDELIGIIEDVLEQLGGPEGEADE
ncbi:MAG: hypothetical protein Q9165_003769 [Trypethelium subeluteriae]